MRTSGVQLIHFQVFWPKRPHIVLLYAAKHLAITNVRAHALTYPLDDVEHLEGGLQIEASNRLTPYSTPGCHVRVPPTAVLQTRRVASFFWGEGEATGPRLKSSSLTGPSDATSVATVSLYRTASITAAPKGPRHKARYSRQLSQMPKDQTGSPAWYKSCLFRSERRLRSAFRSAR
jgi:hypothetical protein